MSVASPGRAPTARESVPARDLPREIWRQLRTEGHITKELDDAEADRLHPAKRDRPVTEVDPGIYAMEWKEPQSLRGLAIKEIDGAVAYLKAQAYVIPKKIGVIGFCMGGGLALHTTLLTMLMLARWPRFTVADRPQQRNLLIRRPPFSTSLASATPVFWRRFGS